MSNVRRPMYSRRLPEILPSLKYLSLLKKNETTTIKPAYRTRMPTILVELGGDIWEFSIKFIKQRHITKITMKKVLNQSFVNNRANWFQYLRQKIPNAKNWK